MFHFLQKRATHGSANKGNPSFLNLSCMLTKFKNYNNDEYSTSDDEGMSVPPMACTFARTYRNGNLVSVVDEDGYVVLYDINKTGPAAVTKSWQAHANAVFDLIWAENDRQILTASGDQTIALWEVETNKKLELFKGHTSSVKSVTARCEDEAVFASGSRDGHVMIWDKRIYHKEGVIPPVDAIYNAHALQQNNTPGKPRKKKNFSFQPKDGQQSVTCVAFQDNKYLVSCGAVDGCIKVWDMRKTHKLSVAGAVPVQIFHYPGSSLRKHGFSCLTLDDSRSRLFASCTDDTIYQYNMNMAEGVPVNCFRGHKNSTFYVKTTLSPDNQFLLSGSSDNNAYLWQVNKPAAPPILLKAHDAEVTSVAWCPIDFTKIVTLSDDAKTKFWRIFCREQKSPLLPLWLGRARKFSKERSTSMVETPLQNKLEQKRLNRPSPVQSPLQSAKDQTSATTTPTRSLRDWLKRKHPKEKTENSDEVSPSKICHLSSNNASLTVKDKSDSNSRKRSSAHIESNQDFSPSQTERFHHCKQICDSSAGPSKKSKMDAHNSLSSPSKSPPKTKQTKNIENSPHLSPRKLFKHTNSDSNDSPTKSKRQCLTPVYNNHQSDDSVKSLSHVKVSLFENKTDKQEMDSLKSIPKDELDNEDVLNAKCLQDDSTTPSKQKLLQSLCEDGDHDSPTRNLPNLVMDRMTNLRPPSPSYSKSSQTRKVDWLTRIKLHKSKKDGDQSPTHASSGGVVKSSPKISKQAKRMKTIHSYFKAQDAS